MNRLDTEGDQGQAVPRCCHRESGRRPYESYGHEHEGCQGRDGYAMPRRCHREYGSPYEPHYGYEHERDQGHDGYGKPRCCHLQYGSPYESYYGHEERQGHDGYAMPRRCHREYGSPYEPDYGHEHERDQGHDGYGKPRCCHLEYGSPYEPYHGHGHRHEDRQDSLMSRFPPVFEDNDDIPCLDEIPTALILAGEIDEQSLMKAALKQQQKKALRSLNKKTFVVDQQIKDRNDRNGRKRNKNANLKMKKKHIELTNESILDTEVWNSVTKTYDGIDEKSASADDQDTSTRKAKEFDPVDAAPKVPNNVDSRPQTKNHKRTRGTGGIERFRSMLNGYSHLLGTSKEYHNFDDYDRLDYTGANGRDDEDIPYAMKLGNLAEAQSNFRRCVFYPDTNRRNQMVDPQRPTKNKNKLPSKNGIEEQDGIHKGVGQGATDNNEEKTLTERDRPPVYIMLPDDAEIKAMPVSMILISSPDVPRSSDRTPVTCEEIEVEDKNQALVMNDAEEFKSDTALHGEESEVHLSAQKRSSNGFGEAKLDTELEHGAPSPSPAPTLTLSTDVLKLADSRHVAFRKIQYKTLKGDHVKCTACRRPECSSQNIKRIKELFKVAEEEGYAIRDVPPDGNCMFAAVVDQLELHSEFAHTAKSLRDMAVHWLIENPYSSDGTHYGSFIEEIWDKYLQRMMEEGQWGDHIVLRSIAQILGRTVMVLNPGESDKRWTRIDVDSSGESDWNAKWVIFLGLAGEFHYMSLVPKEETLCSLKMDSLRMESMMSMTAEEMEHYSLEGVEDVSMFDEDHIDPWSDLPLAHFSFMLKKIVPISCLETAAYSMATYCEESDQVQPALTTIGTECPVLVKATGDIADGVYVPLLNVGQGSSLVTYITEFSIRQDLRAVEKTDPSLCVDDYCLDTRGCHPGYTKIMVPTNTARAMKTFYMPHEDMEKEHGSRIPGHIYRKQYPAIPCAWPLCAATWKDRPRRERWPSQPLIDSVVAGGCCLIGIPHKQSKTPKVEWQLSFSLAARLLMREGISDNQKYCYILFKALCCQALGKSDLLTSDHFKQIFFYACERIPVEFWSSNLAACIVYMTDELMRCFRDRNLPNYFVPSNNMICYFSDQQLRDTTNGLERLRAQPVVYLQQIHNSLKAIHNGEHVIDKVIDDAVSYKDHKSLRRSTLEAFVPVSLEVAKNYIKAHRYGEGFNMISQAYEERLAVSTCDDTVPFQIFLTGALGGLSENDLVWFSVYADKHFEGQIPISLISELSTTYSTVKINEILPDDITSGYGNSLVPSVNTRPLTSFCLEFAKFLYFCGKKQACLPVLYYCRDKYLEKTKQAPSKDGKQTQEETDADVSDKAMVEIYTAICRVYFEQRQVAFFDELVPELIQLCEKLNKKPYYSLLSALGITIGNTEMAHTAAVCIGTAEEGESADFVRISNAMRWPDGLSNGHAAQEKLSSMTPAQLANSLLQYSF